MVPLFFQGLAPGISPCPDVLQQFLGFPLVSPLVLPDLKNAKRPGFGCAGFLGVATLEVGSNHRFFATAVPHILSFLVVVQPRRVVRLVHLLEKVCLLSPTGFLIFPGDEHRKLPARSSKAPYKIVILQHGRGN